MRKIMHFVLAFLLLISCSEKSGTEIYIGFNFSVDQSTAPSTVSFTNHSTGASSFEWNFGDGSISDEKEPVHVYTSPGNYEVTLTAKSGTESKHLSKYVEVTEASNEPKIEGPPSYLGLNSFYEKYVDANGIPIISSNKVPDEALIKARNIVVHMLANMTEVREVMISHHARVGVMAKNEVTTDIPEHAFLAADPNTDWDTRARGLGGTVEVPLTSCAEENLLCYSQDNYANEDILIHEFSHAIHLMGIQYVDTDFNSKLNSAFEKAKAEGKWDKTYAASDIKEYWAEGVQSWFNCNAQSDPANGVHNFVNTRSELKDYDPGLYQLIAQYFDESDEEAVSCHQY